MEEVGSVIRGRVAEKVRVAEGARVAEALCSRTATSKRRQLQEHCRGCSRYCDTSQPFTAHEGYLSPGTTSRDKGTQE